MYSVVIIAIIIIIGVFRKKVIFKINQTRSKTIKIIIIIKFLIIKLKYDTEFRNFMGITKKMITLKFLTETETNKTLKTFTESLILMKIVSGLMSKILKNEKN